MKPNCDPADCVPTYPFEVYIIETNQSECYKATKGINESSFTTFESQYPFEALILLIGDTRVMYLWLTCDQLVTHLWSYCDPLVTNLWSTCDPLVTLLLLICNCIYRKPFRKLREILLIFEKKFFLKLHNITWNSL